MQAVQGLLWEQYRQSRTILLVGLLGLSANLLLLGDSEAAWAIGWLLGMTMTILTIPNRSLRGYCLEIPARLETLPIPAIIRVTSIVAFKLAVALVAGLLVAVSTAPELRELSTFWMPIILLLGIVAVSQIYSVTVSTFGFRTGNGVMTGLVLVALTLGGAVAGINMLPAAALLLMAFLVHATTWVSTKTTTNALQMRSGLRAAVWNEWRQSFVYLPLASAVLMFCFFFVSSVYSLIDPIADSMFTVCMVVPIAVAFGVGFLSFRSSSQHTSITLLRPVQTKSIATAKLLAGTLAFLATTIILVVYALSLTALGEQWGMEVRRLDEFVWGFLIALWVALFCGRLFLCGNVLLLPFVAVIELGFTNQIWIIEMASAVLALLACCVAIGAFIWALRKSLITIQKATVCFVVLGLSMLFWAAYPRYLPPEMAEFSIAAFYISLALLPFAWVPLVIDWQRHR